MRKKPTVLIGLSIAAVLSGVILYIASEPGIGLWSDSQIYIGMARSLLAGHGLQMISVGGYCPISIVPPLYPCFLALSGLFKTDPLVGARWLHIFFFMGSTLVLGLIMYRMTKRSLWTSFLAAVCFFSAYDVRLHYLVALSEACFLFFALSGFYFLLLYLETPSGPWLLGCSLCMSLSLITRYAAWSWVMAGLAAIIFAGRKPWVDRFRDGISYGIICAIPMGLWMMRNLHLHQNALGRHWGIHTFWGTDQILSLKETAGIWLFNIDDPLPSGILVGGAILLGAFLGMALWRGHLQEDKEHRPLWLPILFGLSNALVLIAAAAFLQYDLLMETSRHLLPAHVMLLILVFCVAHQWYKRCPSRREKASLRVVSVLVGLWFIQDAGRWAFAECASGGEEYTNPQYKESGLILTAQKLPLDTIVYTDLPYPIEIYTRLGVRAIPAKKYRVTDKISTSYEDEMIAMAKEMRQHPSVLIYFNEGDDWFEFPSVNEIQQWIRLKPLRIEKDGELDCPA